PPTSTLFPYTTLFRSRRRFACDAVPDPVLQYPDGRQYRGSELGPEAGYDRGPRRRRPLAAPDLERRRRWRRWNVHGRRQWYDRRDRKSTRLNSSHVKI